ncbi:glycosyltransferase family A protein [Paraflavisolibacter sp. H34]|uniref:glycosyltransferase family 2 protein n=1 Tax=Huijunlia imazamoxiresistens TaxID=3127457 RepID=UPI003019052F
MNVPLVSFCIPVHNSGKFLEQTLQSVLRQDYGAIEVVCVNDHSCDDSAAILERYAARVNSFHARRKGAAAARNQAYQHSTGAFIVFLDSDDLLNPGYVSSQVARAVQQPASVVVSKWGRFYRHPQDFREDRFIVKSDLTFHDWIVRYWTANRHMTSPGRVLIPRSIVEKAGPWNEALSLNDDLDFYVRVFSCAEKIRYNEQACLYYRSGIGGLSSKTRGYPYQLSNWTSIENATALAMARYGDDPKVKRACANMWQLFIYDNYPDNMDLVQSAKARIRQYGGADYAFPAGGWTKLLCRMVGWRMVKQVKHRIGR